jgi:hypothetical protein
MVDVNDTGSNEGTGQFSPCDGGNCPCNMSEVEYGIHGVCRDVANPDYGEVQFSIWLNGEPPKTQQVTPSVVQSRPPEPKVPDISDSVAVTVVGAPAPSAAPAPVAQPPVAQQLTLLTNGSGDFNDAGAEFGIWGRNGKASEVRIQTGRGNYVFSIDENSSIEDKLRGRLTPCSGGACSCEMFEEGQDYYMGFCDAADPQNQVTFSIRLN